MGTEEQNAANKANAAKSTGPNSRSGKIQSALNALRHGIYSTGPTAIPRGYFEEDPDEIRRYVAGIVEALTPRDALEHAEASRIAVYFLRLRRLDRFEAEALAGDTASRVIQGNMFTLQQNMGDPEVHAEESAALAIENTLERALIVYYQLRERRDSDVIVDSKTAEEAPTMLTSSN